MDIGGLNITDEVFGGYQVGGININNKKTYILGMQFALLSNFNEGETYGLGFQFAVISNHYAGPAHIVGTQTALIANIGKKQKYMVFN